MEAEAREILTSAVAEPRLVVDWIAAVQEIGVEVRLPARHTPRSVDLP